MKYEYYNSQKLAPHHFIYVHWRSAGYCSVHITIILRIVNNTAIVSSVDG